IGLEEWYVFGNGIAERVMFGVPVLFLFVPREEGEVEDPGEMHLARPKQIQFLPQAGAQRAQRGGSPLGLVGDEEQEVAGLRLKSLDNRLLVRWLEKLCDRRIEPGLGDAEKRQPLRLEVADEDRQFIDLLAAVFRGGSGRIQPADAPARTDGVLKDSKPASGGNVADVHQ